MTLTLTTLKVLYSRTPLPINNLARCIFMSQADQFGVKDKLDQLPKKPAGSFGFYVQDTFSGIKKTHPSLRSTEILRYIGTKWSSLDQAEKERYISKSITLNEKYLEEKKMFMDSLSPDEMQEFNILQKNKLKIQSLKRNKRQAKLLSKPRGKVTSYMIYFMEMFPKREGVSVSDFSKSVGQNWRLMPEEDKKKYKDAAMEKNRVIEEKLREWEEKMIAEGRPNLVRVAFRKKPAKTLKTKPKKKVTKAKKTKSKLAKSKKAVKSKAKATESTTAKTKKSKKNDPNPDWMREE